MKTQVLKKMNYHSKWVWNNKKVELEELSDNQLWSIKETLLKSKNKWFGRNKEYWLNKINPILQQREISNIDKLNEQIELRLKVKAYKITEIIINNLGKKQKTN